MSQDDCIVTSSQAAPFIHGDDFAHVSDTVQFNLNCNAGYATANTPGPSMASPAGREAKAAADEAPARLHGGREREAAAEEEQSLEEVSTPDE